MARKAHYNVLDQALPLLWDVGQAVPHALRIRVPGSALPRLLGSEGSSPLSGLVLPQSLALQGLPLTTLRVGARLWPKAPRPDSLGLTCALASLARRQPREPQEPALALPGCSQPVLSLPRAGACGGSSESTGQDVLTQLVGSGSLGGLTSPGSPKSCCCRPWWLEGVTGEVL